MQVFSGGYLYQSMMIKLDWLISWPICLEIDLPHKGDKSKRGLRTSESKQRKANTIIWSKPRAPLFLAASLLCTLVALLLLGEKYLKFLQFFGRGSSSSSSLVRLSKAALPGRSTSHLLTRHMCHQPNLYSYDKMRCIFTFMSSGIYLCDIFTCFTNQQFTHNNLIL